MQSDYQPYSCSDLKVKFKTARESLDNNFFPEELLNEFADYIDWVIEKGPQNTVYEDPELKRFFFEEFIGGIAKRIRNIKQLPDQFLPLVSRLVLSFGELFGQEVERDNSDMADAIRYIFEQNCALHQNLFQSEESTILKAFHDPQLAQRLPEEERNWRQSLTLDSRLDAVKRDNEHNLKVWAKATVINVDGELIQVVFDNDSSFNSSYFWWYSPDLAVFNSKTQDDEWRLSLKEGDIVDSHDGAKVWYASTIIEKMVIQESNEREYTKLLVGFRIFDEQGEKQDDRARRYIGWPATFDEWINASSPRIQKYQSQAKTFEESKQLLGRQMEETFEDQLDMLLYSKVPEKPVYGVIRQKCRSGLLVTLLNRLGTAGTFQKILDKINRENYDQLSLETVFYYLDSITNCYMMFNKSFVNEYFPALYQAIKKKILTSSEASLKNFKKERVDTLIQYLFNILMTRLMPYQMRENEKNMLTLEIGCFFLRLNFLEKRIDGAKMISEVCKSATQMTFQASMEVKQNQSDKLNTDGYLKAVIDKLKHHKVLYQMFSKERAHQQLVERGEEVLKLMISQDAMSSEDMELVWSATKQDETTQLELYKLFNELASVLKINEINFIIDYLSQVPLVKVLKEQVDLVYEIGKRARSGEQEYGHKAVEYMWRLAIPQVDTIDKVLVNKASIAVTDIIKTWDNSHKLSIFKRIIESLKNNQEGFLCIKMISKLLRDFQGQIIQKIVQPEEQKGDDVMQVDQDNSVDTASNQFENKSKFINYIDENLDLMLHFFLNFKHYMLKARQGLRFKQIVENTTSSDKKNNADSVFAERFCHSDQLNERIEFLKFITVNSAVKISKLHLSVLWKELVEMQMFQEDSDLFYKFIKDVCDMYDSGIAIVELDDIIEFFQEFVFRNDGDESIYTKMTIEGFNSIYSFFLLLNQKNKKIVRLLPMNPEATVQQYPPAPKMTSFNNVTGGSYQNFSFNKSKDSEEDPGFQILVSPWELDGIETIWKIVIASSTNMLIQRATQFLIKLYTCVAFNMESRISEFEDSYLQHCIQGITQLKEIILTRDQPVKDVYEKVEKPLMAFSSITKTVTQRVQPPEESKILKYLTLIKELIFNSEKQGTRGVRSHNGIFKGTYLDCIQVTNSIKNGQKYESKFEFGVQSNTTLFELRKLLGNRAARVYNKDNSGNFIQEKPCHPYSVRIYRYSGCSNLPESDNGKTLRELKFKRNEQITLYKNNVFNSSRVSLLNLEKTDLSDQAKNLFKEWFSRFAEFSDPLNAQSKLVLDRDAVKQFISICTDTSEVKDNDDTLLLLFKDYDPDQDGYIEEEHFMQFWKKSVFDCEQIVWQNIFNFGYRYDLLPQALDGEEPELYQQRKSRDVMPRFKLAANSDNFYSIFSLVETMNPEVANSAWSLIKTISTNPHLYNRVLALDREPNFKWDDIFDMQSINKMLYVLQIVEALIEEQSSIQDEATKEPCDQTDEDKFKQDWFERFMVLGGFQQILKMFHKSLEILSNKSADHMNKFEKNFIEQMLRLIKIFIIAAYSSGDDEQEVISVLELVRTRSKQDESGVATSTEKQEEDFKTPAKNVKGKFVQRLQDKRVQFSNNDIDQPEITTEFLFGDQDLTSKTQDEKKENETQGVQVKDESHALNTEDESMKQFKALARIIQQSGLNTEILNKIDFGDLQAQILELICLILGKQELAEDDTLIIEHALSLWLATLVKNGGLINNFYAFTRPHVKQMFSIRNVEELITTGLFTYKSIKVRADFASTIKCICQKVINPSGVKPVMFFLDVFKRNYPKQEHYFMWRECKFFFETFTSLIEECIRQTPADGESEIDVYEILHGAIIRFKSHNTQETKGSVIEDKTLIGYLQMIDRTIKIIQEKGLDKEKMESVIISTGVLEELFYEHLFFNPRSLIQSENKSKSKESRVAAYSLLSKIMEVLEPHMLAEFLDEKVWSLIKEMKRPKDWKFVPSENQRSISSSSQNYVGIVNLGCICYMNSMMQQFFMVPQFRYQLLRAVDDSPQDLKEYKGYLINDNLLLQLQLMFANLESSERQAFYPLGFCFAFKDFDGNPTNTAIQQDAQEFLGIFFARLEELLKPTSQKHLLDNIFGGKVCSQLKCPECGNIRNRLETFYTLSVAVRDRTGLLDSLQKMIESSIINDFKCENCQKKVDVEKRQLIAEPPNVLIVHLQRIQFDFDTFQNSKINSHFDFPNVLDLKDYSFKKIMNEEGHAAELLEHEDVKHLNDINDDEYIYKLVGVTIHRGTAEHGHYYSLINTKRGQEEVDGTKPEWYQTDKDPWKVFDDETVKYFNFGDMKQEAFGGSNGYGNGIQDNDLSAYYQQSGTGNSYGQSAYMLVYEKMKKKPVKEVFVPEKKEEADVDAENQSASGPSSGDNNMQIDDERKDGKASLEGIDTANSRVNASPIVVEQSAASSVSDQDSYQSDPANGEKYKLIPYKSIGSFVPDWMRGQILQDNQMFLIDRHIYHEQFFNFIKNTLRHIANHSVMTQHQYKYDYMHNFQKLKRVSFQIAQKVMFDMLSYYMYNTSMSDITSSMQTIMTFSDSPYTFSKGDPSLLHEILQTSYMEDNCLHFLTIMLMCTDKTSRFYSGRFTSILFNKIYQIYSDTIKKGQEIPESLEALKQDADKILCLFIKALKSPDCAKNWQKVDQFLLMIYNIVNEGQLQQEVILQNFEIVPYLLDFLLANVNLKISQKLSTFDPIVGLICQFTRFSLTPTMRLEYQQWVPENQEGMKPPSTLLGFDAATMTNLPEKYPLKDESFDYILSSEFVELCLKEGVQCVELGKMIAHLCYKFEKFSKKISKLLLHGISRGDFEKVKSYLDVVTQVAIIKDKYQQSRLEWMFGVGILNSVTAQTSITNDPYEVLTKIGVSALHSMSDEAYQYKSALIQDSIDDSLLHLLWRYKGRMDAYTVNCLLGLLNLISLDDYVAEFFSKLPSPTYCYARYTDWFMPYLEKQLVEAKKGFSGSYSTQKEEIVVKCISLYEKYAQFINKSKDQSPGAFKISYKPIADDNEQKEDVIMSNDYEVDDEEENIRNLISPVSLERGESEGVVTKVSPDMQALNGNQVIIANPQPYVITGCMSEKMFFENDYGNVQLQIFALGCTYTESLPTGDTNLAIPSGVFKRSGTNKHQSSVPAMQQEMEAQAIKNIFQSSSLAGKVEDNMGRRGGILVDKNREMWDEKEEEHRTNDDYEHKVINDGDEQWEMVNNKDSDQASYNSDEYKNMGEVNVNEEIDRFNNENQTELQDQIYRINVVEEGQDDIINSQNIPLYDRDASSVFITNDEQPEPQRYQPHIGEENVQNDAPVDQPEQRQVIWPNQVNYCEDLVYRIQVINYRDCSIKCSVSFNEIQEICEYSPLNLVYPKGGFKCMVQPHSTKTLILLHKIKPSQDGEVDMLEILKVITDFKFKERYARGAQNNSQHSAIPPISLPLRNRNAVAKVHPAQSRAGASTGEAAPLINKRKVNKEIDDDDEIPENNEYDSNQSEKSNSPEQVTPVDPAFFDPDVAFEAGNANQSAGTGNQPMNDDGATEDHINKKQCPQCTLYNDLNNAFCEVCCFDFN